MKKIILFIVPYLLLAVNSLSQTTVTLSGYPIVTTGWTVGGSATSIDSTIRLTTSAGSLTGYTYYNTLLNVTGCGQFSVDFDWQIKSPGGSGVADGIAFYMINPMTSFVAGGGLGLPNPLTGFVFTLDTWDNDGDGLNPECELFGYTSPTTYNENDAAHRLGSILPHVTYMADASWHHCRISYNAGTIRVYMNGSTSPSMTGAFPITTPGYFGFSGSTGGGYSVQSIKSVSITYSTLSTILGNTTICQGSTSPLYDSTSGGTWSSGTTSVATITSGGVVTGVAVGTSVITYTYNSGACFATTTVNVVAPPSSIAGPTSICIGSTGTLTNATSGGTWSSSNTAVATIGTSSGTVYAVSAGTTVITYTTGPACYTTTTVNIVSVPTAIVGPFTACTGSNITLTDAVPGGSWSSSSGGIATIGSSSGVVGGITPGTTVITYSIGSTCTTTTVVTVNATPPGITGPSSVCLGFTMTLADATSGGTWSSTNTSVATITSSGVVTGVSTGTTTISYTIAGCAATRSIVVNPLPGYITGVSSVCSGSSTPLFDAGGGTWSSSDPGVATTGSSSGIVYGVSGGPVTITYTLPTGCWTTTPMTIYPPPSAITGVTTVCEGDVTTLSDPTAGGTWTSSNTARATTDMFSGDVFGVSAGTVTISYVLFPTGCYTATTVTVNPAPPPITGATTICAGTTASLSDAVPGGTWSGGTPGIATVGTGSGTVYGVGGGSTTITYTAPTGCRTTVGLTVLSLPAAVTGTLHICIGQTTLLSSATPGGTWVSSDVSIATVSPGPVAGGFIGGISAGVDTITYTLATGCSRQAFVTVNAGPGVISGPHTVCVGSTITLTDAGGGTWTSSSSSTATVGLSTGIVGGVATGAVTITYSLGGTCSATYSVTVSPLPPVFSVTGGGGYCLGGSGAHVGTSNSTAGFSYQLFLAGSPVGSPVTGTGSALDLGLQTLAGVYTVVVTNPATGCSKAMTGSATVTINPLPAIHNVTGGGTYCSTATAPHIGLDGSDIGIRYQLYNGTTAVGSFITGTGSAIDFGPEPAAGTYIVVATNAATGCKDTMNGSAAIMINPLPPLCSVTGGGGFCAGGAGVHIGLGCSTVAGINYQLLLGGTPVVTLPGTGGALDFGIVTTGGTYTVTATDIITGCTRTMTGTAIVTVNPIPVISGPTAVCVSATATLTATPAGGTWTSSNTSSATIGLTSGVVTGLITGTSTVITYTSPAGCIKTITVNVSPSPGPITGPAAVCAGACVTDSDIVVGGIWASSNFAVATVGSTSGVVCGVTTGTVTITYSLGSGCTVTRVTTVTAAPGTILGPSSVCMGATIILTDPPGTGTWSSDAATIATVNTTTGSVLGVATGTATISYTTGGCTATKLITVNSAPGPITGGSTICAGQTLPLGNSVPGGSWTSSNTAIAPIGSSSGIVTGANPGGVAMITYSTGGTCVVTKTITVNPISIITGSTGICVGATTTLSDSASGGTWSSSATGTATVNLTTGAVLGVIPGTAVITYRTTAGCTAAITVTVQPAPVAISGTLSVCQGMMTALSDLVGGGTWSSGSTSIATVGSLSGMVYGSSPGTSVITYSLGGICTRTAIVTVNALPTITVSTAHICAGTTALAGTGSPGGGTWGITNTGIATINSASGVVTAITTGVDTVTYTITTGCTRSLSITVNPIPTPIGGANAVCEHVATTLTDGIAGGTWSSSNPAIASVGSLSGIVTGGATAGIAIITYTAGGCFVTVTMTVIPPPLPITGADSICTGQTATLSDATPGGTWSTADIAIASIGATTGLVTGGTSSGTALISYTVGTGCTVIRGIIVNPIKPVTGPGEVCVGQSIVLTDSTLGGAWTSGSPSIATAATLTMSTGAAWGASAGIATISYTLPTGCVATHTVTVNAAPPPITGTAQVCAGSTTTLSETISGTWSSSDPAIASVLASGVVTGGAVAFTGTAIITFTSTAFGCPRTITVTVNPVPVPIGGPGNVCVGSTVTLTDATAGGAWSSTPATTATIDMTTGELRGLTPGTVTIVYATGAGCATSTVINVDSLPSAITGPSAVCQGGSITLSDATAGGTWSSGNPATASVDLFSGTVTGGASGMVNISYTSPAGCTAVKLVTVQPIPTAIGGSGTVCQNETTTLTGLPTGGTWTSSDTMIAAITPGGLVTGMSAGSVIITYSLGTGCAVTRVLFVNPAPAAITGNPAICVGTTAAFSDATTGGAWSSSNTAVATTDISGNVTGASLGTATISYTISATGCSARQEVTVNPLPSVISGPAQVCEGSAILLTDSIGGGTWSSSDPSATVGSASIGVITGASAGTATISYSLGAGCIATKDITVNPVPAAITGATQLCAGTSIPLFDATGGGAWSSTATSVATIDATTGLLTGVSGGIAPVSYTLPTGCAATETITVNTAPGPIPGTSNLCLGTPRTFTDTPPGGIWTTSNPLIATIDSFTGVATGLALGSATITYGVGSGSTACMVTKPVTVYPLPGIFAVTGGGNYCAGGTGVPIGLSGSVTGVNYFLYLGATPTGMFPGTSGPLDFGLQTVGGSYTVIAISTSTTCSNIMSGSALVTVMATITPSVDIAATPNDTVCAGTSATFTAVPGYSGSTPTYEWRVNGTLVSTATNYTFVPADGDVVKISMTSSGTCAFPATVQDTLRVAVTPSGRPEVGINVTPNDKVCQGTLVSFTATSTFGGASPAYTWFRNGFSTGSTAATYSYVPSDGDSVRCVMISNYPCASVATASSVDVVISVDTPVQPEITISASPGTNIGKGQYDTLKAIVPNGGSYPAYQWYVNGYPVAGATTDTYISNEYSISRQDSVSCMVTTDALCPVTGHKWVYINTSSVSVQQTVHGADDIIVIPNPNKGEFVIKGTLGSTTDEEVSFELTDMLGQIVYRNKTIAGNGQINCRVALDRSKVANGMYMLNVHTGTENKIFHVVIEQ